MGTHYPGLGVREAISRQEEDKGEEKRVEGKGSVLIQMLSPARTKKANPDPNLKSSSVVRGGGREQTQIQLSIGGNGRTPPPQCLNVLVSEQGWESPQRTLLEFSEQRLAHNTPCR